MVWSIDASFAVHIDMKSHTGSTLPLGLGSPISDSHQQKNNATSTTVSELNGIGDTMPMMEWTSNFTKALVKEIPEINDPITQAIKSLGKITTVLQDNTSTKQLVEFGCQSQGKNTRHIEIWYFYITEKIKDGHMQVFYCPMRAMVADYFTKALHGSLFQTHSNTIMGVTADNLFQYKKKYNELKQNSFSYGIFPRVLTLKT